MYAFLVIVHIIVSIFLIVVILLQAGRGSGLADTFGGSQLQSLFGTKSTNILTKMTSICAIIFISTCLLLAIISVHRSKSLVETTSFPEGPKAVATDSPVAEERIDVISPKETEGGANNERGLD